MTLPLTLATLQRQRDDGLHDRACVVVSVDAEPAGQAGVGGMGAAEPFRWLSITKVATALRAVMAWEAGALSLDDPVAAHLPAFGGQGRHRVTVRHLLTHTAGTLVADAAAPSATWDEDVARVAAAPLADGWVPGRTAGYSIRAGYLLLAETVRRALGDPRPWERVVRDDVLLPLGMAGSHLAASTADGRWPAAPMWDTRRRPPGDRDGSSGAPVPDEDGSRCHPGASGRGPVGEALRLLECLYLGGAPLLGRPAAEAMTARHRTGLHDRTFGAVLDWGLGVILDAKVHGREVVPYGYGPHAGPRTFGHGGAESCGALCDPDAGVVAVLACDGMPGDARHTRRAHEVWDALWRDLGLA